jgi:hypothetical protein
MTRPGAVVILLFSAAVHASPPCALAEAETLWIQKALDGWHEVSKSLRMERARLPWVVLFNTSCVWHLESGDGAPAEATRTTTSLSFAGAPIVVRAMAHADKIRLPNGADIPVQPIAVTSLSGNGSTPFFVMALPEVMRRHPRFVGDPNLDRFFLGVLMHEMVHTQHLPAIVEQLQAVADRYKVPDIELDDDIIQKRFEGVPVFKKAFEAERDMFFQAASESSSGKRKSLTDRGLSMMRERRARYFKGPDEMYAEFEDLFLSMEGAGQWAAFQYAKTQAGPGASDTAAIDFVRDNRKYWSQEEGLALFLLLDALVPDWQGRVFGPSPASPTTLLRDALGK